MKVALCLSGHLRTAAKACPRIIQYLVTPLNADVFVSTWDVWGHGKHNMLHTAEFQTSVDNELIPSLFKDNLKGYAVHCFSDVQETLPKLFYPGMVSMFWQVKEVNKLKKQHEEENDFIYDIVIRLRPDVAPSQSLFLPRVAKDAKHNLVFLPDVNDITVCDFFAFSNSKNMDIYASCFDALNSINQRVSDGLLTNLEGHGIMPEQVLREHLVLSKINLIDFPYELKLVRGEHAELYT